MSLLLYFVKLCIHKQIHLNTLLRWEFIKENKKVRKQENKKTRNRPKMWSRKKKKFFSFFLGRFLCWVFVFFLVFLIAFLVKFLFSFLFSWSSSCFLSYFFLNLPFFSLESMIFFFFSWNLSFIKSQLRKHLWPSSQYTRNLKTYAKSSWTVAILHAIKRNLFSKCKMDL